MEESDWKGHGRHVFKENPVYYGLKETGNGDQQVVVFLGLKGRGRQGIGYLDTRL